MWDCVAITKQSNTCSHQLLKKTNTVVATLILKLSRIIKSDGKQNN